MIIANRSVDASVELRLADVASIYLLRLTVWPGGLHIVPVNREATSDARKKFTASVLKQGNASLTAYWNAMHFKGKRPPVIQESERAMLAFVQKVPGAVGYITASTHPTNVLVLGTIP